MTLTTTIRPIPNKTDFIIFPFHNRVLKPQTIKAGRDPFNGAAPLPASKSE
tara:strand:+ start:417 stop:569 length:153 start_codon:yes stop_codon:yes gene_type:complete